MSNHWLDVLSHRVHTFHNLLISETIVTLTDHLNPYLFEIPSTEVGFQRCKGFVHLKLER